MKDIKRAVVGIMTVFLGGGLYVFFPWDKIEELPLLFFWADVALSFILYWLINKPYKEGVFLFVGYFSMAALASPEMRTNGMGVLMFVNVGIFFALFILLEWGSIQKALEK